MPASVEDRIKDVVVKILKIERARIRPESRFTADLGAESIQSVELIAAFEEEFDIRMDEDAALGVQTMAGAVEFITKCLHAQRRA